MLASLLRSCGGGVGGGVAAIVAPLDMAPYDRVTRDTATARDFVNRGRDTETGRDRLWLMFSTE